MIYAQKINKMPKFYMIFSRKIFFQNFFFGGGGNYGSQGSHKVVIFNDHLIANLLLSVLVK